MTGYSLRRALHALIHLHFSLDHHEIMDMGRVNYHESDNHLSDNRSMRRPEHSRKQRWAEETKNNWVTGKREMFHSTEAH